MKFPSPVKLVAFSFINTDIWTEPVAETDWEGGSSGRLSSQSEKENIKLSPHVGIVEGDGLFTGEGSQQFIIGHKGWKGGSE